MSVSRWRWVLLLVAMFAVYACSENLTGGKACPELCPDPSLSFHDTILTDVVDIDTTLVGYPPIPGASQYLLADMTQRGETLRTAIIARFDTLPGQFDTSSVSHNADSLKILRVDSASVGFNITTRSGADTLLVQDTVRLALYDVDENAPDIDTGAVAPLVLPPNNPIATRVLPPDSVSGVVRITIPKDVLLDKILNRKRFRVGIRIFSGTNVLVKVLAPPLAQLELRFTAFSLVDSGPFLVVPNATRERPQPQIPGLNSFTLLLNGKAPPPPGTLVVGGLPGRRAYLRFKIPSHIIDSTTIVRATLLLRQRGDSGIEDSIGAVVQPHVVAADTNITDLSKVALLIPSSGSSGYPVVAAATLFPRDSGTKRIPMVAVVQFWQAERALNIPVQRALVLTSGVEGIDPRRFLFYDASSPVDSLRPRLEIGYIPSSKFGLP